METGRVLRKRKSGEGVNKSAPSTYPDKRKQQRTSKQQPAINLENEDICRPVKIETSVCDAEGTNLINQLQINLLSHCILCLRRTTSSRNAPPPSLSQKNAEPPEMFRVVPRADLSQSSSVPLSCFNFIWAHFGKKNKTAAEADGLFSVDSDSGTQNKSAVFLELPTMCIYCVEDMEAVHKLVQELRTQLGVLERVKLESKHGEKYSWRAEHFQRALRRSNLDKKVIEATHQILDLVLDDRTVDVNQVRFSRSTPSSPLRKEIPPPVTPQNDYQKQHSKEIGSDAGGYSGDDHDQDNWSDIEPDYIKSEPEEEDDFSEDEEVSLAGNPEIKTRSISIDQRRFFAEPVSSSVNTKVNSASKSSKKIVPTKTDTPAHSSKRDEEKPNPKVVLSDNLNVRRKRGRQKTNKRPECDICGNKFPSLVKLRQHKNLNQCSKDGNVLKQMCDLCKVYVPLTDMYTHVREHIGEEYLIKCPNPECPRVYSSSRYLYRHLKTGRGTCRQFIPSLPEFLELTKTCQLCGHKATTASSIRGHLSQMHETPTKNFSCPIENCRQRFTVRQSVVCHIYQHDMRRAFEKQKCDGCRKMIKLEEMEEHLKKVHEAEQVVKCKRCPFMFSTWQFLLDHLFVHRHGDLTCDICEDDDDFKYYRIQHLRKHYFSAHGIGAQFSCTDCDRVCWTQEELTEHAKRQHGRKRDGSLMEALPKKRVKIIKCDACDASFIAERYLRSHKIKEHGAEPWGCKLCTETFFTMNQLWIHEREHKAGSRLFKCDREDCGRSFRSNGALKYHTTSFHLSQRHVCELCGKSYSESGLAYHKVRVHSGLAPADICEVCGESFMGAGPLKRHKLIHTGERPFSCQICGQRFRHKSVLATHLESHRRKGADFKPKGPMKHIRKRVEKTQNTGN